MHEYTIWVHHIACSGSADGGGAARPICIAVNRMSTRWENCCTYCNIQTMFNQAVNFNTNAFLKIFSE